MFWLLFLPAAAYQSLASLAALGHLYVRRRDRCRQTGLSPGISILKPIRGMDPNTYEAFVSQVEQRYSAFEILFGVTDASDPAAAEVHRLQREYPQAPIRLIVAGPVSAGNSKAGVLIALARHAQYPVWVVNDSDIRVDPEYLSQVAAPLADRSVGVVTCLYRAKPHTMPAAWEALGIATDFMPSTLVAQLLGVREFGLGSTLAFRAADLKEAGGFEALADYLADDYQLAKRITGLGKRALLSTYTVETALGEASWAGVWRHQIRWARTIRTSKGGGYAGLPITHAGVWALLAVCCGAWFPALALVALRMLSALLMAGFVLQSSCVFIFWLAPCWDLYAFCVWATSYAGRTVRWRDRVLTIDKQGRIRT
jgi:ceramide glucosyltransferase